MNEVLLQPLQFYGHITLSFQHPSIKDMGGFLEQYFLGTIPCGQQNMLQNFIVLADYYQCATCCLCTKYLCCYVRKKISFNNLVLCYATHSFTYKNKTDLAADIEKKKNALHRTKFAVSYINIYINILLS